MEVRIKEQGSSSTRLYAAGRKMIVLKIFSGLCAVYFFVILIRSLVAWNNQYKAFIDFCRLEGDTETMAFIGYKEFYGEEYGLRRSYSLGAALERLNLQYEKTSKKEYFEYGEYIRINRYKNILYVIAIFLCIIVTTIQV